MAQLTMISNALLSVVLLQVNIISAGVIDVDTLFEVFKVKYGKVYVDAYDELRHKEAFTENYDYMRKHNVRYDLGEVTYRVSMGIYSDQSYDDIDEINKALAPDSQKIAEKGKHVVPVGDFPLPTAVDWRLENVLTNVKNQGTCGSCWAFAAATALEAHAAIIGQNLTSLAPQEFVDCAAPPDSKGCSGGYAMDAFEHAMQEGIATEEDYPYMEANGECARDIPKRQPYSQEREAGVYIRGNDETAIMHAVATVGPVVALIHAGLRGFAMYSEGVYDDGDDCTDGKINHAVVIVGYGEAQIGDNNVPYWIIRNSWGNHFGKDGYILLRRGTNACRVSEFAHYPTLLGRVKQETTGKRCKTASFSTFTVNGVNECQQFCAFEPKCQDYEYDEKRLHENCVLKTSDCKYVEEI